MLDQLLESISGAWWNYPLIFVVAMLDAFFPVVPSESVVITGGVVAAGGNLDIAAVIALAAAGAIVGDNVSYFIGSWLGEHTAKRILRGERSRKGFEWAERQLEERGTYLIVIARFIPGGRTVVTLSAGYVHTLSWRRFVVADVVAGVIWATYAALLGYVGGRRFEEEPWKGLLLALAAAVGIAIAIEVGRHWLKRRRAARPVV